MPFFAILLLGACGSDGSPIDQHLNQIEETPDSGDDLSGGDADGPLAGDAGADHEELPPGASADSGAPDQPANPGSPSTPSTPVTGTKPAQSWSGMRVGTNFWFLSAGWAEEAWSSGVNFATSMNPWNPAFLSDLEEADYSVYRFMDFGGTNNSSIRNWADRTQQSATGNSNGGDVGGRGIAYEWMFDLCNRMQKDCWITVPHLAIESYEANADDNFFTSLAKLAKEKLDPGLTLYVEYSNETWNPGFGQSTYCQNRGTQMMLADDSYGASFKFHVYASSRMYDAFVKVYGSEIARVRWVVSGQLGSDYGTQMQLEALADPNVNFGSRTPDYYAISNYVGADGSVNGNAADVAAQFRKALTDMVTWATSQKNLISKTSMKLISYEGGQHLLQGADAFSRNQVAYDLYKEWLDASAKLYAMTTHYANSGSWSSSGAWGAKEKTGGALSQNPKARAIVDWVKNHPAK
ncbi:MAG: hypothetical protein QM778_20125 [Myxococcales bacterium]